MNAEPMYYGCWNQIGHYWHHVDGSKFWRDRPDDRPTPWGKHIESLGPKGEGQGVATLSHKDGWTALAIADRTVDSRPNSWSIFAFPELLTFDGALDAARRHFPHIVERIGVIRLASPTEPTP